jgi:hypothetical protein
VIASEVAASAAFMGAFVPPAPAAPVEKQKPKRERRKRKAARRNPLTPQSPALKLVVPDDDRQAGLKKRFGR